MKTCQPCGTVSDAATCPHCGEASWAASLPPVEPAPIQFTGRGLLSDDDAARFDPPKAIDAEPAPTVADHPDVSAVPDAAPSISASVGSKAPRKRHNQ